MLPTFALATLALLAPGSVWAQDRASIGGLNVGVPLGVSISIGRVLGDSTEIWGTTSPYVGAEVGALGASVFVGRITPWDMGSDRLQVGVMQWWARGQNTYVGLEWRFGAAFAVVAAGAYARVHGTRGPFLLPALTFGIGI